MQNVLLASQLFSLDEPARKPSLHFSLEFMAKIRWCKASVGTSPSITRSRIMKAVCDCDAHPSQSSPVRASFHRARGDAVVSLLMLSLHGELHRVRLTLLLLKLPGWRNQSKQDDKLSSGLSSSVPNLRSWYHNLLIHETL